MSKQEITVQELESLPEKDLDALLRFIHSLRARNVECAASALLSQSSLVQGLAFAPGAGSLGGFVRTS